MNTKTILLLILAIVYVAADPVSINIDINCQPGIFWCGSVLVYEQDFKYIMQEWYVDKFCTSDPQKIYRIGDLHPGGDTSPEYEVGLQLTHNCTSDRMTRCYEPQIRDVNVVGPITIDYNLTIFQKGIERACIPPQKFPWST